MFLKLPVTRRARFNQVAETFRPRFNQEWKIAWPEAHQATLEVVCDSLFLSAFASWLACC